MGTAVSILWLSGPGGTGPVLAASLRLLGERGYVVHFEGAPGDLLSELEGVSQLVARSGEPPTGIGGLRRRAQSDVQRMGKVLQSRGYFEGTVAYEIDLKGRAPVETTGETGEAGAVVAESDGGPVAVTVLIVPGPQYVLGSSVVAYQDTTDQSDDLPQGLAEYGIVTGEPAIAKKIIDAEKALAVQLRRQGYPFAKTAGRKALADVGADVLNVTSFISLGDKARFGALKVLGLERVEPGYIERRQTFAAGETYDQKKINDMRTALVRSGLFDVVRFDLPKTPAPDGTLPMTLTVTERAARTVGAGASYSSTEGFGVSAQWEHRNLLGGGQHLALEATLAQIEQLASIRYRVAGFRRADQTLELGVTGGREETDVYKRLGVVTSAAIERPLADKWMGRAGVLLDVAQVDEVGERNTSSLLVGAPIEALYDNADSLLDPTKGMRLRLSTTPYAGHYENALAFNVADAELRTYLPLDDSGRLVFATRARLGAILGARTGELPADKRFYAGGAGSIRGFEYQEVAPLGSDGTPEGGRSVAELSTELRWRFMDDFGVVPFVDAGLVSDAPFPDFEEELAWAGGLGFRYYTSFGPIGVDLAYPIATPSDEEPSLKFYVKLGQAF